MARGKPRPSSGRSPGRRGKAGVGPGPGYKPSRPTKGTKHKGSAKPATPPKKCCSMVEALRSVKKGNYRLARRYAALSIRLIAAKMT